MRPAIAWRTATRRSSRPALVDTPSLPPAAPRQNVRGPPRHADEAFHSARPTACPARPVVSSRSLPPFFYPAEQGFFDGARMHLDPELLPQTSGEFVGRQLRLGRQPRPQMRPHRRRQLVGTFRPAFVRIQSLQASRLKVTLRLIERWSRQAKLRRRSGNRVTLDLDRPHRFVFELEQILRIEERRAS